MDPEPLSPTEWERVVSALAALVRDEYPSGLSLSEIARRWGADVLTAEQLEAIERYENSER